MLTPGHIIILFFSLVVIVSFPLDDDPTVSMIAWTTTPWTLPSNLALCVHPNMSYVKVKGVYRTLHCYCLWRIVQYKITFHLMAFLAVTILIYPDKSTDGVYIMMEDRLEALFKTKEEYIVLEKMTGESLEGKKYKPLFPYFEKMKTTTANTGAFRILW